jgi:hypothetical protein
MSRASECNGINAETGGRVSGIDVYGATSGKQHWYLGSTLEYAMGVSV